VKLHSLFSLFSPFAPRSRGNAAAKLCQSPSTLIQKRESGPSQALRVWDVRIGRFRSLTHDNREPARMDLSSTTALTTKHGFACPPHSAAEVRFPTSHAGAKIDPPFVVTVVGALP
jgi:hypothetical protein